MRAIILPVSLGVALIFAGCGAGNEVNSTSSAPFVAGVGLQTNGVATNRAIDVQFSTAMDPRTIDTHTFLLAKAAGGANVAATVTYDATNFVASLKPAAALDPSTSYNASVTTGATDLSGHALAAPYTFAFTTRTSSDSSNISVYQTVPSNGQTGVALSSTVQVVFSEGATSATVNSSNFLVQDGSGNQVTGAVTYDIVTNTATFTPSASLTSGTVYKVTISGVTDLAGEPMVAPYIFSFTTAGTSAAAEDLVYETDVQQGTILGWVFDSATGTLTQIPGSPFPTGSEPLQIIVSPNDDFLYVLMGEQTPGVRGANCLNVNAQVYSYAIDHLSGALTQVQQVSLNGFCATQQSGAIDPMGHFLYVGERDSTSSTGLIDVLSLGSKGQISLISGSPFASPEIPNGLAVAGNYVYGNVTSSQQSGLLTYQRNPSTGAVQYQSTMAIAEQASIAALPSGGSLYTVGFSNGLVSEFAVDPTTGSLAQEGTVPSGAGTVYVVVDPTSRYTATGAISDTNLYDVSASGNLTPVPPTPSSGPAELMFDSTGSYLATQQDRIRIYSVSPSALHEVGNAFGTFNPGGIATLTK